MDIFWPLHRLAEWFILSVVGLPSRTPLAEASVFFIYDSVKILILLTAIIFIVSVIRSYLPPERIRFALARKNPYVGHISAGLLGIVTPFCSCSAVPLFLGFVQAGVPLGVTFSFLVASPMINEVALAMLFGMFGWKVAFIYVVSGLAIAVGAGVAIGRMKVENLVEPFVFRHQAKSGVDSPKPNLRQRASHAAGYTSDVLRKIWPYVLSGIGVGAWIHGYVPADFLVNHAGSGRWYAVPLAVLVGIPLYSNAAGIIPLVSVLTQKGVAMGTTLAFMMAVTALSLPEFMILKKVMKPKLILIFAATVGIGITFIGYLFNSLL